MGNSLISIVSYRGIYNGIVDLFSIRMYLDRFIGVRRILNLENYLNCESSFVFRRYKLRIEL